jgi:hypothetical protein
MGAITSAETHGIPRLAGAKTNRFEQFAHFMLVDELQRIRSIR